MARFQQQIPLFELIDFGWPILSEQIPAGHGKAYRAQWKAAKKPAALHQETRQQRRAAERRSKKGGA
jgi:hypothetical protein